MKNRIGLVWLALLTVYQSFTTTDMYSTLRTVEGVERCTLRYMEKSTKILKRLKNAHVIETGAGEPDREASTTSDTRVL